MALTLPGLGEPGVQASSACTVRLSINQVDAPLSVLNMRGVERLSELYRFEIDVAVDRGSSDFAQVDADALDLAAAMGQKAKLTFHSPRLEDQGGEITVGGMVARMEQRDRSRSHTRYRVTLVPRAAKLTQRSGCRIFQGASVKEIAEKLLEEHGLSAGRDFKFSLKEAPAPREYCVQYRESDWDFLCRLLEEEGIYFFFRRDAQGEVLQFGDDFEVHPPIPGAAALPYRKSEDVTPDEDYVGGFAVTQRLLSGAVTLRDWNFLQPDLENSGSFQSENKDSAGPEELEVYDHPGRYAEPGVGNTRARVRMEQISAERRRARGGSSTPRLAAGYYFELESHYRGDLNERYLLLEVLHEAKAEGDSFGSEDLHHSYGCQFTAQPRRIPFRPPVPGKKPAIHGVQTALVVGASGQEIDTDEHARIKVKFHWDRAEDMEAPTCWVRVAQLWGSDGWGAMFIPRIGQEVVVSFEEGDPDRPLVVGTVYYGAPPYPLPAKKTVSTIKSNTSPGGSGSNELRFEDKKDAEEIYVHAQKDLNQVVENDEADQVGNNREVSIGVDDTLTVGENRSIDVGKDLTQHVGGNEDETIDGNLTLAVGKSSSTTVGKDLSLEVTGAATVQIDKTLGVTVKKKADAKLEDEAQLAVTKTLKVTAKKVVVEIEDELAVKVGQAQLTMKKNGDITISGGKISVASKKDTVVDSKAKIQLKGSADVKVEASGNLTLKGAKIAGN